MSDIMSEIRERIARLEEQVKRLIENDVPHLNDEMKSIRKWIYGILSSVILSIIYAIIRDIWG